MNNSHSIEVKRYMESQYSVPPAYIDNMKSAPLKGFPNQYAVLVEAFDKEWSLLIDTSKPNIRITEVG
ncbi:hypothetical protein ACPV5L_15680 [Vibrio astriarenae]|jgi:hypothetical protein|uniref:SMI1/KNR4 family protein n=1 Tax=Vibrio agarivorans TaxID=153622 RepID=A0ABT7Y3X0_9VIBR|nr:hypothetical protein [Vibrio agarivorans]MDN2482688.1 hypothetical protein [Vibrio agarivorans]MDN3660676.1 hypothetical protein [Vibrio agarivorans]